MKNKKYVYTLIALIAIATLAGAVSVSAQEDNQPGNNASFNGRMHGRGTMKPSVFGTVSAVSGNIITMAGRQGFGANSTTATYTVDTTNAKITKNNAAGTIASIVVGDTIAVQGTMTGTNIVATTIRDGVMNGASGNMKKPDNTDKPNQDLSTIVGNGQPVIAGSITAINGNTITITNKSNITYAVDVSSAKFVVIGVTSATISNVKVGDNIVVQGAINGTSVTASSIIDQTKPVATSGTNNGEHKGFFGTIGSFFSHLFGF